MNCIHYCLYCCHKEKEFGKSICSHRWKPPDMRLQRVRNPQSVLSEKRQLLSLTYLSTKRTWAPFRGLLHWQPPFIPTVFQRIWPRFVNMKILAPQNSISLPRIFILLEEKREVTYSERRLPRQSEDWWRFLNSYIHLCMYVQPLFRNHYWSRTFSLLIYNILLWTNM